MKSIFLTLLLGAAGAPAAMAQARAGGNMSSKDYTGGAVTDSRYTSFGIKGGYNLSSIYGSGKDRFNPDALNTFHGGVYGQFGSNQFSSVQVELLYSRKGYLTHYPAFGQQTTHLDYLQLPVLYVGKFTKNLSFHVGPQVALLTQAKVAGRDIAIADGGFNSLDYGAVAGLEASVGSGSVRIGVRYDLGLGSVYKDGVSVKYGTTTVADLSSSNVHNQTFQVYLGMGFTQ